MASGGKKWEVKEVEALIDAWKDQPVLYAVGTPNYHNKHLRKEALKKVVEAMQLAKPGITEKDCTTKFHNLRSQFNVEHAKVNKSHKSGSGADDVYKPGLWYYHHLLFLGKFYTPRNSRNSISNDEADILQDDSTQPLSHFQEGRFVVYEEDADADLEVASTTEGSTSTTNSASVATAALKRGLSCSSSPSRGVYN